MSDEKKRLTAAQARELSGPTVDERVDEALEVIRAIASAKGRKANLTGDFWRNGGDAKSDLSKQYKEAVNQLNKLGFLVRFHYEERQFVEMWTIVEW